MSPVAIGSWNLELAPSKKYQIVAQADLRITNVSLGEQLADDKGRSVVKVTVHEAPSEDSEDEDDEPSGEPVDTVLCSLRAGAVEQTVLDVTFLEGQGLEFQVTGKNTVYLLGNYINQLADLPSDDDSDMDEGAFRLEDVSSDVEMDPAAALSDDDDDGRFEEVPAPKPGKKKAAKPDSKPAPTSEKPKSKGGAAPPSKGGDRPKSKGGDKPKSKGPPGGAEKPKSKKNKA